MYVKLSKLLLFVLILIHLFACNSTSEIDDISDQVSNNQTHLSINLLKGEMSLSSLEEFHVKTLDLFLFDAFQGQKETSFFIKEFENTQNNILTSTTGSKTLIGVANYDKEGFWNCQHIDQIQEVCIDLESQYSGLLTMVGEQSVEIKEGYNQTQLDMTRLVGKVILKNVTVEKPYDNGHIKVTRAFMMNVNATSKLRGKVATPEVVNPVYQGYIPHQSNYMLDLSADIKITGNNKENLCQFYVFENTSEMNPTVLFIEAEYKQQQGNKTKLVYYPIVIKSEGEDVVLRNNVYTLSAKIKRPGTTVPEINDQKGDLEVNVAVEDWIDAEEQDIIID